MVIEELEWLVKENTGLKSHRERSFSAIPNCAAFARCGLVGADGRDVHMLPIWLNLSENGTEFVFDLRRLWKKTKVSKRSVYFFFIISFQEYFGHSPCYMRIETNLGDIALCFSWFPVFLLYANSSLSFL